MSARLTVKLGADGRGLQTGLNKAKQRVSQLKSHVATQVGGMVKSFGLMAAAAYAAIQIKQTIEWATRIRDISTALGVTTGFIQKMDYAFKQSGMDAEVAFKSIRKMMLKVAISTNSLTSAMTRAMINDAFQKLGISAKDMQSLKPEEMFMKIAKAMQHADRSSAELHDALNVVFGKAGSELLIVFSSGLADMVQRVEELNAIVDDATIQALGSAGDQWEEFGTRHRSIWAQTVGFFLDTFSGFINFVQASVNVIATNLIGIWEMIGNAAAKVGEITDAIRNREFKKAARLTKEFLAQQQKDSIAILRMGHGGADDIGQEMLRLEGKDKQKAEAARQLEAEQKAQKEAAELAKQAMAAREKIEKIEEKALKRKWDGLTTEQKLLDLMMQRVAATEELGRMEYVDDAEKKKRLAGLKGKEKAEMAAEIEETNLAYREQQERIMEITDKEEGLQKGKKDKKEAVVTSGMMAGSIKDTYTNLSRIGGQIGARNPLVENSEKTLEITKESAGYLSEMLRIQTNTFGP